MLEDDLSKKGLESKQKFEQFHAAKEAMMEKYD